MAKKAKDTTSIGFEEKIWKAADILRGNLSASQYEGVVLGLIFLKYISDRFDQKFQELQGDDYADPEDKDEYTADNIFFVPQEARWSKISAAAHKPEIGEVIDGALSAIERENQRLKGILPKNFARPELEKRRLGEVVDLFTNVAMHDAGEEKDLLGRTYEYCLQQFASLEGKNGGEFYTPSCIVRTLVQHMIHHLAPNGKIGLVLANGALSSQSGGEGQIRQAIIEADLVEGIVALPSQLFYSTGIPVSLWFISRNKQQAGKTVFIDARNLGTMVTRKLRELMPDTDIKKITDTFHAFQQGTLEDEKGFCAVCTTEQIAAQDFILTPGRYVGIAEDEGDGVPFEEKMTNLTGELKQLFEESKKQEEKIRLQLKKIGWEV